jgi:hypothetical protein
LTAYDTASAPARRPSGGSQRLPVPRSGATCGLPGGYRRGLSQCFRHPRRADGGGFATPTRQQRSEQHHSRSPLTTNAALAVIDGVRPRDEIEAMLAAHMAVTNIALLELVARMREAAAGHLYQGNGGTQRLQVFGNLTTKFMRTYAMQVEALARKRRTGEQRVTVKYVHVHPGAQAIVGNVHQRGRGVDENDQRPYGRAREAEATTAVPKRSPVRGSNQKRETLPFTSDEEGALSTTRRRKR